MLSARCITLPMVTTEMSYFFLSKLITQNYSQQLNKFNRSSSFFFSFLSTPNFSLIDESIIADTPCYKLLLDSSNILAKQSKQPKASKQTVPLGNDPKCTPEDKIKLLQNFHFQYQP